VYVVTICCDVCVIISTLCSCDAADREIFQAKASNSSFERANRLLTDEVNQLRRSVAQVRPVLLPICMYVCVCVCTDISTTISLTTRFTGCLRLASSGSICVPATALSVPLPGPSHAPPPVTLLPITTAIPAASTGSGGSVPCSSAAPADVQLLQQLSRHVPSRDSRQEERRVPRAPLYFPRLQ
jgi:hypothetical protein